MSLSYWDTRGKTNWYSSQKDALKSTSFFYFFADFFFSNHFGNEVFTRKILKKLQKPSVIEIGVGGGKTAIIKNTSRSLGVDIPGYPVEACKKRVDVSPIPCYTNITQNLPYLYSPSCCLDSISCFLV